MTEKIYFQYPLCVAAYGRSDDERMKAIIAYCGVKLGAHQWAELNETERADFLSARHPLPAFNRGDGRHCAAVYGIDFMGLEQEEPEKLLETHDHVSQFVADFEAKWKRDAKVRVRRDIVLAARRGDLPFEHFRVFGAILSLIGAKTVGWGTLPMLRARVLGYKSNLVMNGCIGERRDGQQPMTDDQLRASIKFLQTRKFLGFMAKGKKLFFSIRVPQQELERLIDGGGDDVVPPALQDVDISVAPLQARSQTVAGRPSEMPKDMTLDDVEWELQSETNMARREELYSWRRSLQKRGRVRPEDLTIGPEELTLDDIQAEMQWRDPCKDSDRLRQLIAWKKLLEPRVKAMRWWRLPPDQQTIGPEELTLDDIAVELQTIDLQRRDRIRQLCGWKEELIEKQQRAKKKKPSWN